MYTYHKIKYGGQANVKSMCSYMQIAIISKREIILRSLDKFTGRQDSKRWERRWFIRITLR